MRICHLRPLSVVGVVGVVGDARVRGARESTRVETFVPYWQLSEGGVTVVLKGTNPESCREGRA